MRPSWLNGVPSECKLDFCGFNTLKERIIILRGRCGAARHERVTINGV